MYITRDTLNTRIFGYPSGKVFPSDGNSEESSPNFRFTRLPARTEFSGRRTRPGASPIEVRKVMLGDGCGLEGRGKGNGVILRCSCGAICVPLDLRKAAETINSAEAHALGAPKEFPSDNQREVV